MTIDETRQCPVCGAPVGIVRSHDGPSMVCSKAWGYPNGFQSGIEYTGPCENRVWGECGLASYEEELDRAYEDFLRKSGS